MPAWTIAAVSEAAKGRPEPVLGFASDLDPRRAARRAVSEAFQMEFGLRLSRAAVAKGRGAAHESVFRRIEALETAQRDLVDPPAEEVIHPEPAANGDGLPDLGPGAFAARLTADEIGVPVWRVVAPALPSLRDLPENEGVQPM